MNVVQRLGYAAAAGKVIEPDAEATSSFEQTY